MLVEVADLMAEVVYWPTGLVSDKPMTVRMAAVKISAYRACLPHRDNLQTRVEVLSSLLGISHSRPNPARIKLCINSAP